MGGLGKWRSRMNWGVGEGGGSVDSGTTTISASHEKEATFRNPNPPVPLNRRRCPRGARTMGLASPAVSRCAVTSPTSACGAWPSPRAPAQG